MDEEQNSCLHNLERDVKTEEKVKKKVINFMDYYIYEPERKQIFAAELSPCAKFFCVCDSLSNAFIYSIKKCHFLYLFKLTSYFTSPTISIMWITKKNRKEHLYMNNEYTDYLIALAFLNGNILFYDLENKCIIEKMTCNSSITRCKLNNSLEYFGFTDLNGFFHYYSIYKNEHNFIYNCYDTFFQTPSHKTKESNIEVTVYRNKRKLDGTIKRETAITNGEPLMDQNELWKDLLLRDDKNYEEQGVEEEEEEEEEEDEEEDDEEKENVRDTWCMEYGEEKTKKEDTIKFSKLKSAAELESETGKQQRKIFENEKEEIGKREEEEAEVFDIVEKIRFSCPEKLICFYFMDVLKNLDKLINENKLLKKWDKWKHKCENKEKKKKKNDSSDSDNEKKGKKWSREKVENKLNKKIEKIQKCFKNYKHYVLLGTDKSKIYKYCLKRNICVGEFRSINENTIIWDVVYIYRTNEVACVDNQGALIIFDNDTRSVKYHIQGHMYKALSITKGFNERCIFTAGVDRFIRKYSLQKLVDGEDGRYSFNSSKDQTVQISAQNNTEDVTFSSLIQSDKYELLHKKFYIYDYYREKNVRRSWVFISKYASHVADIKKIINVNDQFILSVSDDLSFCLNDALSSKKYYYYLINIPDHKNIHFSENLKVMLCEYSNKIRIHLKKKERYDSITARCTNKQDSDNENVLCYIREQLWGKERKLNEKEEEQKQKEREKQKEIEEKQLMKIDAVHNAKSYQHIANINCNKYEHIDIIHCNKHASLIGCLTNRRFCLYSCKLNKAAIFNFDLSNLGFCKVYDFCFIGKKTVIISLMKMEDVPSGDVDDANENKKISELNKHEEIICGRKRNTSGFVNAKEFFTSQKKLNDTGIYDESLYVNAKKKESKKDIHDYIKQFGGVDLAMNAYENDLEKKDTSLNLDTQLMRHHANENMKFLKKRFGFYLVVYHIKKKIIKEERKMKTYVRNFKFSNKGVVVCSDNYKNIYVLFKTKDSMYFKNVRILKNFNISGENLNRVIIFYLLVEDMLFLFGMCKAVYTFKLDIAQQNVSFYKKFIIRGDVNLNDFREICLFNLGARENCEQELQMLKMKNEKRKEEGGSKKCEINFSKEKKEGEEEEEKEEEEEGEEHKNKEQYSEHQKWKKEITKKGEKLNIDEKGKDERNTENVEKSEETNKINKKKKKKKKEKKKRRNIKTKETSRNLSNYYCLICKRHDKVHIFNVNMNAHVKGKECIDILFNVDNVDTQIKDNVSMGLLDQLYYNALEKKQTFYFNKKQKFLRDIQFFSKLTKSLKTGTSGELVQLINKNGNNGFYKNENEEKKHIITKETDKTEFCFNALYYLLLKYTVDVACGHDKNGNLYVLVCVPKTMQGILIPMANTKKYKN